MKSTIGNDGLLGALDAEFRGRDVLQSAEEMETAPPPSTSVSAESAAAADATSAFGTAPDPFSECIRDCEFYSMMNRITFHQIRFGEQQLSLLSLSGITITKVTFR